MFAAEHHDIAHIAEYYYMDRAALDSALYAKYQVTRFDTTRNVGNTLLLLQASAQQ